MRMTPPPCQPPSSSSILLHVGPRVSGLDEKRQERETVPVGRFGTSISDSFYCAGASDENSNATRTMLRGENLGGKE